MPGLSFRILFTPAPNPWPQGAPFPSDYPQRRRATQRPFFALYSRLFLWIESYSLSVFCLGVQITKSLIFVIPLLACSNLFMTVSKYAHLKKMMSKSWIIAPFFCWPRALGKHLIRVSTSRIGSQIFIVAQQKILQEVIPLIMFVPFTNLPRGFYLLIVLVLVLYVVISVITGEFP